MPAQAGQDTSSNEWKLACLGRHICRMPTRQHRNDFLDLMRKKHTPEFMATLEQIIKDQWVILHRPTSSGDQHGNA